MIYTLQKIGTDAEIFLKHRHTFSPVPVVGLLGGTKLCPKPIPNMINGFAIQEDNVMPEFNIPAASTAREFSDSINQVLEYLTIQMREHDLMLDIVPSMHFKESDLQSAQAQNFGCEPDLCAWTDEVNEIDRANPKLRTMRTAAAHIHVSYLVDLEEPKTYAQRALAVRAHDLFVGVPSILVDSDTDRREIYGKAGAFRCTDYGHEYRTPSNFWIRNNLWSEWVFNQTRNALSFVSTADGRHVLENDVVLANAIQDSINGHDEDTALMLCNEYDLTIPTKQL